MDEPIPPAATTSLYVTKIDGTQEPFDENKLAASLKNSGGSDTVVADILSTIRKNVTGTVTTTDIYRYAFELLRTSSVPVALRYSLRRALAELGPDGFPFEKFVAEIFKSWGYETLTDQILLGSCITHELDVVAWNPDKLIIVEAKFHNEFGLKSDTKVALYVKARFDDLKGTVFNYGGKERHIDECWVMTNTKFTEQAIKYGECNHLKMIGWNHPSHGNLHDLIEEHRLHPFTALSTLSAHDKKNLLKYGALLCRDIKPEMLKAIGCDDEKIAQVMTEVALICQ